MNTNRHRHFVVLPLLLAGLIGPFIGGNSQTATLLQMPHRDGETVTVGYTLFQLETGSDFITSGGEPRLRQGSALVESASLARVVSGDYIVSGLAGGFHLSVSDSALTVAGLTTPVHVSGSGQALVPIGYQWRSDTQRLARVPASFLEETLPLLSELSYLPQPYVAIDRPGTWRVPLPAALLLSAEEERRAEDGNQDDQRAFQTAITSGDRITLQTLLQSETTPSFAADTKGRAVLLAALSLFADDTAIGSSIINLLSRSDEAVWLLCSQHPAFAAGTWLSSDLPKSDDNRGVAIHALPFSQAAYSPLVVRRWGDVLAEWLSEQLDPVGAAEQLSQSIQPHLADLEKEGYPEQARAYRAALLAATEESDIALPAIVLPLPSIQEQAERRSRYADELPAPLHPSQIVSTANDLLQAAGVLQTVNTTIKANGLQSAAVSGVMISGETSDRIFDFTLNAVTGAVSDIQEGQMRFSNSLPLGRFVEWASE